MITKSFKPPVSILSKAGSDSKSVVIDERLQSKRAKEVLDQILYLAINNKELARELCIKAAVIAGSDKKLFEFIKKALKKNNGRPTKWMPWMNRFLLIHYSQAMISHKGNHEHVRNELIDFVKRMHGPILTEEAIENRLSKAINNIHQNKISLNDFPDWAKPIILDRIKKGKIQKKLI